MTWMIWGYTCGSQWYKDDCWEGFGIRSFSYQFKLKLKVRVHGNKNKLKTTTGFC